MIKIEQAIIILIPSYIIHVGKTLQFQGNIISVGPPNESITSKANHSHGIYNHSHKPSLTAVKKCVSLDIAL